MVGNMKWRRKLYHLGHISVRRLPLSSLIDNPSTFQVLLLKILHMACAGKIFIGKPGSQLCSLMQMLIYLPTFVKFVDLLVMFVSGLLQVSGIFLMYGAVCFLSFLFLLLFVPETKGRTLEQLSHHLQSRYVPVIVRCLS